MAKKSEDRNVNKAHKENSPKQGRAKGPGREEGSDDEVSGYRQKMRGIRMANGSKSKSGCSPKLFMLLLPFMAAGAYLFLRS